MSRLRRGFGAGPWWPLVTAACVFATAGGCGGGQIHTRSTVRSSDHQAKASDRHHLARHMRRVVNVRAPVARNSRARAAIRAARAICGVGSVKEQRALVLSEARHALAAHQAGAPSARFIRAVERARGRQGARLLASLFAVTRPRAQRGVALAACAHELSRARGGL